MKEEQSATPYIYVFLADSKAIKIGVSSTPYARLSAVKNDRRYRAKYGFTSLSPVLVLPHRAAIELESRVHRALSREAIGGEWFMVDRWIAVSTIVREGQQLDAELLELPSVEEGS